MNTWIVFVIGYVLGFSTILGLGAYVYFRDYHKAKTISTEGINKDVLDALSESHDISSEDEDTMTDTQEDTL